MEFRYARFEAINADVNYLAGNIESYSPKTKEPGHPCYAVVSKLPVDSATADTLQLKNIQLTAPIDSAELNKTNSKILTNEKLADSLGQKDSLVSVGTLQNEVLDYFREQDVTLTVFPNPFKNEINLSYQVSEEDDVSLYVYDITGNLVLQKAFGHQAKGSYLEKIQLYSAPGQYVLRLVIGNDAYSKIIIKQ